MPKTRFLVDGITALEISVVLLVETLAEHDPELGPAFIRAVNSILRSERLSEGTRRNLETLRSACEGTRLKRGRVRK